MHRDFGNQWCHKKVLFFASNKDPKLSALGLSYIALVLVLQFISSQKKEGRKKGRKGRRKEGKEKEGRKERQMEERKR